VLTLLQPTQDIITQQRQCWITSDEQSSFQADPSNGLFSRTTGVSQHQKGQTNLDFNEARDDGVAVASAGPYENHLHLSPER